MFVLKTFWSRKAKLILEITSDILSNLKCNAQQALNTYVLKLGVCEDKRWYKNTFLFLSAPDNWASVIVGLTWKGYGTTKIMDLGWIICPIKWLWWQRVEKTVRIWKIRLECLKFLGKNLVQYQTVSITIRNLISEGWWGESYFTWNQIKWRE